MAEGGAHRHQYLTPETVKFFSPMEGEQPLAKAQCQERVGNFKVRGRVPLKSFHDGIIGLVESSFFNFFLFETGVKSVKSGEAKSSSLTGATDGVEEISELVIGGDMLL
ncbi:hypothetical protein AVEN_274945-1 [Araneus ventricosus]|uniref:Uncharacterized protein n=1 Tax=Araneus ventricosus TaxID=182803 RepID=A0A4Y2QIQ6_ARAVE|nr:hypothetical protein AVEN_274945-1 [Araneus ventricosus]